MISVEIFDEMNKEVKEKIPDNRGENNGALLVKLCQKVFAVCETYKLYKRMAVATMTAAATDAAETVRIPICAACQTIPCLKGLSEQQVVAQLQGTFKPWPWRRQKLKKQV